VIARAKQLSPDTEAIVLTGKSSLETAVGALRQGAFDYLTKPCKLLDLDALLRRVAEKRQLTNKYRALRERLRRLEGSSDLIGDSAGMELVRRLIAKVAPTNSTVLVVGETGTGKELVARALHDQSLRAEMPFVPINCGALPENLIESELFGHRKGAFTGAEEHRIGLFEVAHGGTLLLDEIGELPKSMQAKLLRFLESGEVRRVGDNDSFTCDVRVICATNRRLDAMVAEGDFREDLWFRVNTFEIPLPPLRERIDDIRLLARHLAVRNGAPAGRDDEVFTPEALAALEQHTWPGNVRELANVIEHALILCDGGPIRPEHLPQRFAARPSLAMVAKPAAAVNLRDLEMRAIQEALDRHSGNKPRAAEELGISLKTLYNKLNQAAALGKSA
jgi:two-component system NtrC family response regulator